MIDEIRAFLKAYKAYLLSPKGRYEYSRYALLLFILTGICMIIWSVMSLVYE